MSKSINFENQNISVIAVLEVDVRKFSASQLRKFNDYSCKIQFDVKNSKLTTEEIEKSIYTSLKFIESQIKGKY